MLGDAHVLYQGVCDRRHDCGDKHKDRDDGLGLSMVDAEAGYVQMLLGLKGSDEVECDDDGEISTPVHVGVLAHDMRLRTYVLVSKPCSSRNPVLPRVNVKP